MSVINKDLGVVTAYAYAVEAGYTGTEEEFEQALGDLAELVTDFENFTVEVTTLEPGSSATASYADGVLSLGIPEGEKGDTGATPNLTIGAVTTLAPGSDATATITGTAKAPVLSLGIPEGDPGEVPAAALASDFSASVSYKKGDYVWRSGTLYEFTADHAAGAWTGSDATAAKVADDVANLSSAISAAFITETASGSVVTIDDGADGIDSKSYTLTIEPHQAGSGDPSPDNVRAITGYTSVDVTRAGKNLCINQPAIAAQTVILLDGKTKAYSNLIISMHVTNLTFGSNSAAFGRVFHGENLTPVRYYVFNSAHKSDGSNFTVNGTPYTGIVYFNVGVIEEGVNRINLYPYPNSYASWSGTIDWCVISSVDGEIVTEYEPYIAETESIPFPTSAGTVYGGTLTKNADGSGKLVINRKIITLDGSETVSASSSNRFYVTISDAKTINTTNQTTDKSVICDKGRPTTWGGLGTDSVVGTDFWCAPVYGKGIAFRWESITTASDWGTYFAGNPTQFSYELATPTEYTIPAEDMAKIPTLKGENTVWMSADGSISLDYYADTKMYIDKLIGGIRGNIAYIEDSLTASRAYTAGQYVMVSGTLYRVATSIASGATFTPGTNIIATTVGTELTAVNA